MENLSSSTLVGNYEKEIKKEFNSIVLVLVVIAAALILFNQWQILSISGELGGSSTGIVSASEVSPTGLPKVYGQELGIRYDDVSPQDARKADATIGVLANLDRTITLTGADKERYIKISLQISCEYCCGAESIIFQNGEAACGCAHSYAMRGIAKYLIKNHGTEFSDDEILEEMGKWKVLFFPGVHQQKAAVLKSQGIELSYINLASNKYRDIEKGQANSGSSGASGSMVGGC